MVWPVQWTPAGQTSQNRLLGRAAGVFKVFGWLDVVPGCMDPLDSARLARSGLEAYEDVTSELRALQKQRGAALTEPVDQVLAFLFLGVLIACNCRA